MTKMYIAIPDLESAWMRASALPPVGEPEAAPVGASISTLL